jgi:hypothetical protein
MAVQGVQIASHVDEVLDFVNRRGYALGLLVAEMCGRYETPWDGDEPHPLIELHGMTEEVDTMARAVVMDLMDEP